MLAKPNGVKTLMAENLIFLTILLWHY